jgi:hypothetical protein
VKQLECVGSRVAVGEREVQIEQHGRCTAHLAVAPVTASPPRADVSTCPVSRRSTAVRQGCGASPTSRARGCRSLRGRREGASTVFAGVEGAGWIVPCTAMLEKMLRSAMACVSGHTRPLGVLE